MRLRLPHKRASLRASALARCNDFIHNIMHRLVPRNCAEPAPATETTA